MSLLGIAIIALFVVLILSLPVYPYSRNIGPYPSGVVAIILAIVVLWALFGTAHPIR
jgi:hypothetical protein